MKLLLTCILAIPIIGNAQTSYQSRKKTFEAAIQQAVSKLKVERDDLIIESIRFSSNFRYENYTEIHAVIKSTGEACEVNLTVGAKNNYAGGHDWYECIDPTGVRTRGQRFPAVLSGG